MTDERFTAIIDSLRNMHEYQVETRKRVENIEALLTRVVNKIDPQKEPFDISKLSPLDAGLMAHLQEEAARMSKRNDL
ncbi:hypothetical protein [Dyadobacter chenhuakuii]|uniref:Uncharacterized protein n=1 Tax=Dyadobacter chenhuakuii TaxID=2909339 RepID=A0A9X1QH77_9BACT|nr:hypothetical protein [Dyadobacter chenhuakuii]MCF2500819.1 hypothetical protein [Dyadobacter chenhuakuii]